MEETGVEGAKILLLRALKTSELNRNGPNASTMKHRRTIYLINTADKSLSSVSSKLLLWRTDLLSKQKEIIMYTGNGKRFYFRTGGEKKPLIFILYP